MISSPRHSFYLCIPALVLTVLTGCKRENRVFDPGSAASQLANGATLSEVHTGGPVTVPDVSMYEDSAYAVAEGKRLYNAYNCVGCHAQGEEPSAPR